MTNKPVALGRRLYAWFMQSEFLKHQIPGGVIVAVVSTALIASAVFVYNRFSAPGPLASAVELRFTDTKLEPQPVNKKGDRFDVERATFVFTIKSDSDKPIHATSVGLLVDEILSFPFDTSTLLWTAAIDHDGYSHVWIPGTTKAGDFLPVSGAIDFEPLAFREFKVWFKSTDTPSNGVLVVRGRMQVRTADGVITGEPISVEIHDDSQEMHYPRPSDAQ